MRRFRRRLAARVQQTSADDHDSHPLARMVLLQSGVLESSVVVSARVLSRSTAANWHSSNVITDRFPPPSPIFFFHESRQLPQQKGKTAGTRADAVARMQGVVSNMMAGLSPNPRYDCPPGGGRVARPELDAEICAGSSRGVTPLLMYFEGGGGCSWQHVACFVPSFVATPVFSPGRIVCEMGLCRLHDLCYLNSGVVRWGAFPDTPSLSLSSY